MVVTCDDSARSTSTLDDNKPEIRAAIQAIRSAVEPDSSVTKRSEILHTLKTHVTHGCLIMAVETTKGGFGS